MQTFFKLNDRYVNGNAIATCRIGKPTGEPATFAIYLRFIGGGEITYEYPEAQRSEIIAPLLRFLEWGVSEREEVPAWGTAGSS